MLAFMKELIDHFLDWVFSLMPLSPFASFIDELEAMPYLGYINWFIPIGKMLELGMAWLTAIFLWYFYGVVLRWIRAIE